MSDTTQEIRIIVDGLRVDIVKGRHGLYYATSLDDRGLFVSSPDIATMEDKVKRALKELNETRHQSGAQG